MIVLTLARKRPAEPTVTANLLLYGAGGLNIQHCRIAFSSEADKERARPASLPKARLGLEAFEMRDRSGECPLAAQDPAGRWPANLMFSSDIHLEPGIRIFKVFPGSG